MRPTKPANPQPDTYEPADQPEQKPKICPYCGAPCWNPYIYTCGSAACGVESILAPLKRWDREAIEITQAEAVAICEGTVRPCAGGCGRNVSGRWDKCARCEERHEKEFEEANNQ